MGDTSSPTCDVCVVNYNTGPLLGECLASLVGQPVGRVFVIDNASTDASLDVQLDAFPDLDLEVVRNASNVGFAAGCNMGLARSGAQRILFLNPDARAEAGSIARLVEVLDSAPDIGMVGGYVCNPDGSEQAGARRRFPAMGAAFVKAFGLSWLVANMASDKAVGDFNLNRDPLPNAPIDVEAVSGSCMMVKRSAVDTVGAWDEGYFLHCEDLDWCRRFHDAGLRVMFVPDAPIMHVRGVSSRSRPVLSEWHKHRGMLRFFAKFDRPSHPALVWPLVVAGVWIRFCGVAARIVLRRALGRKV